MADRIKLVVGCDPAREVLPIEHLAFRLRVEERHDGFLSARLIEAEDGKRTLREGQCGQRHGASEHVTTGERLRAHRLSFFTDSFCSTGCFGRSTSFAFT